MILVCIFLMQVMVNIVVCNYLSLLSSSLIIPIFSKQRASGFEGVISVIVSIFVEETHRDNLQFMTL